MTHWKRYLNFAIVAVSGMFLVCCAVQTSGDEGIPVAGGSIVTNPGFEELDGSLPAGWLFDDNSLNKGEIAVVAGGAQGTNRRLRLRPNADNSDDILALNVAQAFDIEPLKNHTLVVSGRLGAEGETSAVVLLSVIDGGGGILANATLTQGPSDGELIAHRTILHVPAQDEAVLLMLNCQTRGQSGEAYFDDIDVRQEPEAATAAITSESRAAKMGLKAATAVVTIDAGRDLRRIDPNLYGVNVTWPRGGNGILGVGDGSIDPAVLGLSKELKPSLIRFPGGTLSDFYYWRDGIGPRGQRPKTEPMKGEKQAYAHDLGTDEALAFAKAIGSRLLITVNAGTGSAREAANWVRYVNIDKARKNPSYRVEQWEVGNELYLKGEIPMSPKSYADKFLDFARAMRAVDPTIKIGALGSENYFKDKGFEYTYPQWTETILKKAGHAIDFLAIHNAYAPSLISSGYNSDVRTVYRAMLAAPRLIEKNLQQTTEKIRRYAPQHADRIKLAVTEWGPFFAFDPKNRFMDHVKTLGSALYTASVMQAFLRNPKVEIANFFQLTSFTPLTLIALRQGTSVHDWLDSKKGIYLPNASYYALQLYTRHFGEVLIDATTVSDTFDSKHVGWVEAAQDVPYLDVVASRSADRKTLYILAVNKHFDADVDASIALKGFTPDAKAKVWTLNGKGIDAHTGTAPIRVPGVSWPKPAEALHNTRIRHGGPGEIEVRQSDVTVADKFRYSFPAHSVTALVLHAK